MYYTIINSSGGNHGHQLKDWIGGYTLGKLLGLKYYHTNNNYLDYFLPNNFFKNQVSDLKKHKTVQKNGPLWNGIQEFNRFKTRFNDIKIDSNTLYEFRRALRVHPFQTISWFNEKDITADIFKEVCLDLKNIFYYNKEDKQTKSNEQNVCIHVNLAYTNGKTPNDPRYKFPVEYYLNIADQLEKTTKKKLKFSVYAEEANSDIIIKSFTDKKYTLHIGANRSEQNVGNNMEYINSVFKDFIDSDILVCSNSSFSVIAAYFRFTDPSKVTIYHPHVQLSGLDGYKNFIETNSSGKFK
jgi:hypothetical protein